MSRKTTKPKGPPQQAVTCPNCGDTALTFVNERTGKVEFLVDRKNNPWQAVSGYRWRAHCTNCGEVWGGKEGQPGLFVLLDEIKGTWPRPEGHEREGVV